MTSTTDRAPTGAVTIEALTPNDLLQIDGDLYRVETTERDAGSPAVQATL